MSKALLSELSTRELERFLRENGASRSQASAMAAACSRAESPKELTLDDLFDDHGLSAAINEALTTIKNRRSF